ncbi:MAG: serine hydrolase domain-containing protein, partial [Pyrinomonadaceae bacterium]
PSSEGREFISIAAILMEEDGVLRLDDPVRKYFPKLPEWSKNVTLWDLLNHRSGFVDEWAEMMLTQGAMSNRFDLSEFLNLLYRQPNPSVEPGKGYMYSNSDFGLLRLILEKASGKNLSDWLKQRVFDPLKMFSTRMQDNSLDIVPNNATVYMAVREKMYQMQPAQKTSPGGNYFILTNADDLERWSAAQSDSSTDVAKATARLLANVRIVPVKDHHYVFGQSYRKFNGETVVFHEGVNGFNYLTRVPAKGLAVITIGNLNRTGFAYQNNSIVEYLLTKPGQPQPPDPPLPQILIKPISVPKQDLKRYAGRYLWQDQSGYESYLPGRKTSDFVIDGDVLKCRNCAAELSSLIPVGKALFYFKDQDNIGYQIEFSQPARSARMQAEVRFSDGFPPIKLQRESVEIWRPSKYELSRFRGKYYSKHLDYYWTLELNKEGQLVIKRPTVADTVIDPDGLNQFHLIIQGSSSGGGSDGWMLFHKDKNGKITHFTV